MRMSREKKELVASDLILRQIAPLPVQPIGQKTGILDGFFQNWKLEQRAKSTALIKQIAENQNLTVQAHAQSMQTMLNFNLRVEAERRDLQGKSDYLQEEVTEKRLKNQILYYQAELERIAVERAKKATEEE
jgi:hypothetical protein